MSLFEQMMKRMKADLTRIDLKELKAYYKDSVDHTGIDETFDYLINLTTEELINDMRIYASN
jgi:hypothetical protein